MQPAIPGAFPPAPHNGPTRDDNSLSQSDERRGNAIKTFILNTQVLIHSATRPRHGKLQGKQGNL